MTEKPSNFDKMMSGRVSEHPLEAIKSIPRPILAEQEVPVFTTPERPSKTPEQIAQMEAIRKKLEAANIYEETAKDVKFGMTDSSLAETIKQGEREDTRKRTLRKAIIQRIGLVLAGLGIVSGYAGVKSAASDKPLVNKEAGSNEYVVKPNTVNQDAANNLKNGNNVEGSTVVTEDSDANINAQDNLDNQNNTENLTGE